MIGAGANWTTIRTLSKQADAFFSRMPYSAIDATVTDVGGAIAATSDPELRRRGERGAGDR